MRGAHCCACLGERPAGACEEIAAFVSVRRHCRLKASVTTNAHWCFFTTEGTEEIEEHRKEEFFVR